MVSTQHASSSRSPKIYDIVTVEKAELQEESVEQQQPQPQPEVAPAKTPSRSATQTSHQ